MRSRALSICTPVLLGLVSLALRCNTIDSDGGGGGGLAHACNVIPANDIWASLRYVELRHNEPRHCPRLELFYSTYGAVLDVSDQDVTAGQLLNVEVYSYIMYDEPKNIGIHNFYPLNNGVMSAEFYISYTSDPEPHGDIVVLDFQTRQFQTAVGQVHVPTNRQQGI